MRTGLSTWVYTIARALEAAGVDPNTLLADIGMDPARLGDRSHRYSQEQVTQLWIAAVEATGDSAFGLKVARQIRPSTFDVVGYAMSCSATLRKAVERFARNARLISDSVTVEFIDQGDRYTVEVDIQTGGQAPVFQTIDTIIAGLLLFCEWIARERVTVVRVDFKHTATKDAKAYREIFGPNIHYDQPVNSITFRAAEFDRTIPSSNEDLASFLEEMASRIMRLPQARFTAKVREALIGQLPNGDPTKRETARLLATTERTLLRRLQEEGASYQDVLDQLRQELAQKYLRRADLSTDKISELLGFSSSSTFSRAFVRWTGQRPSDWRRRALPLAIEDG